MPELPEVETVRRGLAPLFEGRRITGVEVLDERLVRPYAPRDVEQRLAGHTVGSVGRRGKYLLLEFDDVDLVAIHHLRMTGSFASPRQPTPTHVRLRYHVEGLDGPVVYNDPRRFGTLELFATHDARAYLDARLGPEPLDPAWTAADLHAALRRRHAPLKAVLLDQKVVAGLGNIYVDEACLLAGVRPDRPADRITRPAATRLHAAIRSRLEEAIDVGGSTLRDYRGVEGEVGSMRERFVAYGRAGLPCLQCGTTMRGTRIAGRSTSWCPRCQPAR
ncbi:MAG: bifunctional DNA-formamidopyrimidine glycosylase/DNA-(apurinic or apyrimidinic site) lyase [Thermoleophilia bacterium]|nr:bifunctional DNA-formamidopyrimidine glycosylase/DNA-(apurinic or apyrimidinic site) lyase [Thermoleophilia bacterium]